MAGRIEARLEELGITLPAASIPQANYVPYVVTGNLVFIAGQIPIRDGNIITGKLGDDADLATGQKAARLCALNLISQLRAACGGDLDSMVRVVKLGGFVNATPDFTDPPQVMNGASDLIVEIFGDSGRHARFAVAVACLPRGSAVEVDGVFEIG
jgi:enamine deaminase RidA (YjgF/YER057c/UK114 family)